jgi:hypothetical protein
MRLKWGKFRTGLGVAQLAQALGFTIIVTPSTEEGFWECRVWRDRVKQDARAFRSPDAARRWARRFLDRKARAEEGEG